MRIVYACLILAAATTMTNAQSAKQSGAVPSPSVEQLQQAIDAVRKGKRIGKMLGCLPAAGKPAAVVCVLQASGSASYQELPFRYDGGRWRLVLDESGSPAEIGAACAPLKVAEAALRKIRGDGGLRVTGSVDEGEGTFTDARGVSRNRKGPYRLMCRYNVSAAGGEYLYLAYVWHDGSRYVIDPDVEIWND